MEILINGLAQRMCNNFGAQISKYPRQDHVAAADARLISRGHYVNKT